MTVPSTSRAAARPPGSRPSPRRAPLVALLAALLARAAAAGASDATPAPPEAAPAWSFSASAYGFLVPDARDYVNPNVTADRGGLHLEARYNYEAFEAGSAWVGWTFAAGEALALELTPMLGGVFGSASGIAPGWLLSLAWRDFSLSSQSEWLIDPTDSAESFFYTWSELDWSPTGAWRVGLAIQRTKAYETTLEIQRGVLAAVSWEDLELAGYVFNLGWTDPTVVLALALTF